MHLIRGGIVHHHTRLKKVSGGLEQIDYYVVPYNR